MISLGGEVMIEMCKTGRRKLRKEDLYSRYYDEYEDIIGFFIQCAIVPFAIRFLGAEFALLGGRPH